MLNIVCNKCGGEMQFENIETPMFMPSFTKHVRTAKHIPHTVAVVCTCGDYTILSPVEEPVKEVVDRINKFWLEHKGHGNPEKSAQC